MSAPRKTTTITPTISAIPVPARITAKLTIPRPAVGSSSKASSVKPNTAVNTNFDGTTPLASSTKNTVTPSSARARTTSSSTRGVNAASSVSGNTLPIPKSPASRSNLKTPSPSKPRPSPLQSPQTRRPVSPSPQPLQSKAAPLSVREAIALKRAEAKKAQLSAAKDHQKPLDSFSNPNEIQTALVVDDVELSRWSIRESIERAKSSGSLNLSSRSLHSIPSALFEIHLGVTPEPLKNVPKESDETILAGKTKQREDIPWFEVVDLTVMKLRDNMIIEIQPEISLFGSLRTLDLRNNRLKFLPDSISDLVNLVNLDVSANQLTCLPPNIASLPLLATLDVSSNQLTSLPVTILSSPVTSPVATSFFSPVTISRASRPLPSLRQLLASNNQISALALPKEDLPPELSKLDLSFNPLGHGNENTKAAKEFIQSLSTLPKLKQLILEATQLDDSCFDFFFSTSKAHGSNNDKNKSFSVLELLNLGKTKATEKLETIFSGRPVSFEGEAIENGIRIILGDKIQKEAWEIEAEKRVKRFQNKIQDWEIEAGSGPNTEDRRRRQTRLNEAHEKADEDYNSANLPPTPPKSPISPAKSTGSHGNGQSLAHCYTSTSQTLALPRALPLNHNRSRSLAVTSSTDGDRLDPIVPTQTLPLPLILVQPFAKTLTTLVLSNRRSDISFAVPETFFSLLTSTTNNLTMETEPFFPHLEELRLDGCLLGDVVNISTSAQAKKESLLSVLDHLFPTLSILDLCDNSLTHVNGIVSFLIPAKSKSLLGARAKGLKTLRLRGNKLLDTSGLDDVADILRKQGKVEGWRLEELDLRENEIAKLSPILGYLLLDVMLVEGNIFRVPARRVWEVEGTKGLLNWLKGRVDS